MNIFGVPFTPTTRDDIQKTVTVSITHKKRLRIATVNPEFLLAARKNTNFQENLLAADVRLVDGVGISLLTRVFFGKKLPRVTGAEMTLWMLQYAERESIPVVVFHTEDALSSLEEITRVLSRHYPKLTVSFNHPPTKYSVVFCTYGAPHQEFFLETQYFPSIYMGVGGTFDYLTGAQKRAPQCWQRMGVEWLWRLLFQPRRFGRICRAVVIFPLVFCYSFLKEKMVH